MMNRFTPSNQAKIYSEENGEAIEFLNDANDTEYRSIPYDYKNAEDLIEALDTAIAEFFEILRFAVNATKLTADVDEAVEKYRPYEWLARNGIAYTPDFTLTEACAAFSLAADRFYKLLGQLETELRYLFLRVINGKKKAVKERYFGPMADKPPGDLIAALNDVIDGSGTKELFRAAEVGYNGEIDNSVKLFCSVLQKSPIFKGKNEENPKEN